MNPFRILNRLAEATAEKSRVDAFGPDYRQRQARSDLENAIQSTKLKEAARTEAAEIRAAMDAFPGEQDPDEAISKYRAGRSSEAADLVRRKAESEIDENQATAEYTRARPEIEGAKLQGSREHQQVMEALGQQRVDIAANKPQREHGPWIQIETADGPAMFNPESGRRVQLPGRFKPGAAEANARAARSKIGPVLASVDELSRRINTGDGLAAKAGSLVKRGAAALNLNDDVSEYESVVSGFIPMMARAVGHTGVLTQQDVDSARALFPRVGDSKSIRDRKMARVYLILQGGEHFQFPSQTEVAGGTGAALGGLDPNEPAPNLGGGGSERTTKSGGRYRRVGP